MAKSVSRDIPSTNAAGICLLHSEKYDEAISVFRELLGQVRQHMLLSENLAQDKLQIIATNEPIHIAEDQPFLCFTQPFVVISTEGNESFSLAEASSQDLNLLVCTLFFNLGLSHHLRSLSGKSPSWSHDVARAIALYKYAVRISSSFTNSNGCLCSFGEDGALCVSVAIGNNLAVLLSEIHEYDSLREYLEWVLDRACFVRHESCDCFWVNMLSWRASHSFAAAVA